MGEFHLDKTQVKVYFSLYGDDFPIDNVTEILGIKPTNSYKKGDVIPKKYNPNVVSTKVQFRKETAWEFGTDYQESNDVKVQLDHIIRPLKNKATIINQLKSKYNLECDFSIVIIMENGETPGLHLDNEQIEFANNIKAEFDIDLYANPYKGI
ncbi:TPR domain-containing protein [Bacillus sp. 1NLA3E]|nr:TPR domain-containing protein [Bacillus sp. 1NLA3E]